MKKPEREIYEAMCGELGLEPEEILFVGNNLQMDYIAPRIMKSGANIADWKAANPDERREMEKGGMRSVLLARDGVYKPREGVEMIGSLCEILNLLGR